MAWIHHRESRSVNPLDLLEDITIVALDRSIYIIGHEMTERELQVHIFHVDTFTRDIVRCAGDNSDSFPRGTNYFAVAHNDSIFLYVHDYGREHSLFVFNTKNLQWNRLPVGDVFGDEIRHWCGGCLLHEELYILRKGDFHFYDLWALDLGMMRWRIVSAIELVDSYNPMRIVAYETRIYLHLGETCEETTHMDIVYYDTVNKRWEWLDAPEDMQISLCPLASFIYSKHIYYVSEMSDEHLSDFVFRYSLERSEWENISFEGVQPAHGDIIGSAVVLDNKAFFLEFGGFGLYVLDLEPSLKVRCLAAVSRYELDTSGLPTSLQTELLKYKRLA